MAAKGLLFALKKGPLEIRWLLGLVLIKHILVISWMHKSRQVHKRLQLQSSEANGRTHSSRLFDGKKLQLNKSFLFYLIRLHWLPRSTSRVVRKNKGFSVMAFVGLLIIVMSRSLCPSSREHFLKIRGHFCFLPPLRDSLTFLSHSQSIR